MERIFELLKRYNYIVVFLVLETIAIIFMAQNSYYQSSFIVGIGNSFANAIYNTTSGISQYFGLKTQNEQLAMENARLRAHIAESYIYYDTRDFNLGDSVFRQYYTYTEAKVIKCSYGSNQNYLMINKGSLQGIKPDQAVISPQGVVGTVIAVSDNFATIMPVIHPDSRNSVKLKRIGTNGTLVWDGLDYRYASVIDIPTTHKLNKGDTVVTSGLSKDFPKDILVGFVYSQSSVQGSGFYTVKLRLSTDFNRIEHVYVVSNRFVDEQDSLNVITEKIAVND